ncbi:MAG: GNAT family N-acetyltransferase [Candidatus Binatia bacterium]
MARSPVTPPGTEPFEEKDFYLEEFRGKSVLVALSPAVVAARPDLTPLARAVADLVRNGARVLVWWPVRRPGAERRLLAALGRARALARRRGVRRPPAPVVRTGADEIGELDGDAALRGDVWAHVRQRRLCVLAVRGKPVFPRHPTAVALALRVSKMVLIDAQGGLAPGRATLSFVDESLLETLVRQGEAEWSGLGDRRAVLVAVRAALAGAVEAVNVCTLEGIAEELFSYEGSGTLFTKGDYCRVGPLGLDDFAQAERMLERGQREGLLKLRTHEEIADILGSGFGATISERHLVGVAALLTAPYAAERAGEIVGLYTITRFKGEGIGDRLIRRILDEAAARNLAYVFAVAVDERAQHFFIREGFARAGADDVPEAKWDGYDARRRSRVGVFRLDLAGRRAD